MPQKIPHSGQMPLKSEKNHAIARHDYLLASIVNEEHSFDLVGLDESMTQRIELLRILKPLLLTCLGVLYAALINHPAMGQAPSPASSQAAAKPVANGTSALSAIQSATAETQSLLEAMTADVTIEPEQKARLIAAYQATLNSLRAYSADTERLATFAKSAALAADKLSTARERIKQPKAVFVGPEGADRLPIEDLRQRRSESEAALAAARQTLQMLEASQRERETRRAQLPKLITDARMAVETTEATPLPPVEGDSKGRLQVALEAERAAKLQAMRLNIEALTQEQATIDAEAELLPAQIEVAKSELALAEQRLRFWSEKLGMQKQYRVENDLAEHREQYESEGIDIKKSLVLQLEDQWIELLREQSRLDRKLTGEQTRFAELNETLKSTQTEIDRDLEAGRGLRSGLGLKLQMIRSRLPSSASLNDDMEGIDKLLDRGRALQTTIELTLENLRDDASGRFNVRSENSLPIKDGVVDPGEVALVKRMKFDLDQHLNTLIDIKGELELKRTLVSNFRLLIEKHVIWIRNAPPYHLSDLRLAWDWLQWIVMPNHPQMIFGAILAGMISRIDLIIFWTICGLLLWCAGSRIRRRIFAAGELAQESALSGEIEHSLRPTLTALLLTIVLAVPPVVTLATLGFAILESADKDLYLTSAGSAFLLAAVALFPMETLRQMLRPGGLAIAHFGYRREIVSPPRTSLRFLIDLGIPMLIIWRIANEPGRSQMDASLGRLVFAIGMTSLSYLIWHALHPKTGLLSDYMKDYPDSWTARLKHLWHSLLTILPATLAALSLMGYSYTATLFTGKLYWTLWLGIGVLVLGGLLRQWLIAYRRRIAARVREEKSLRATQSAGRTVDVKVDKPIDIEQVNAQSLRLIQAVMWIVALVGIGVIWAHVFPAIGILDAVPLWDTTASDGSPGKVTLKNLVIFIPIVILSYVAVRNLPGLLEGLLLERLPLDRPARYAITTLASYAFATLGIFISARTLGLRWEGIQWLVAALGVGLGFGLQEIFANFVSGLILLFEQPIRVGDVVTIDGVTGTVARIRMRATVVTNHDRQELIIPNKDLITGRLINWTLTDSTNRLTLNIGIAYGSDTRKACKLLEQICAQHENLLVDPEPMVTFEAFGDSTLNIVVRCFLGTLDQRLQTIHELNTTINDRFNEEKIEISFPQRDLHIRSWPQDFNKILNVTPNSP